MEHVRSKDSDCALFIERSTLLFFNVIVSHINIKRNTEIPVLARGSVAAVDLRVAKCPRVEDNALFRSSDDKRWSVIRAAITLVITLVISIRDWRLINNFVFARAYVRNEAPRRL